MIPLEEASEVLVVDLRFGFEELTLRMAERGSEGGFYSMVGYRAEEVVDRRVGDGSSGRCSYW